MASSSRGKEKAYEELSRKLVELHAGIAEFSSRMEQVLEIHQHTSELSDLFSRMYVEILFGLEIIR